MLNKSTLNPLISVSEVTPSQYKNFSCGEPVLDEYLKRYAKDHQKIGIGRTFVLLQDNEVLGYYTLSAAQMHLEDLPESHRKKLPRYPIPASRLGRLVITQSSQNQGIGAYLLSDVINRILQVDASIAIHSLIVNARNIKAKSFYLKYGFIPLNEKALTLFLPISTLRKA